MGGLRYLIFLLVVLFSALASFVICAALVAGLVILIVFLCKRKKKAVVEVVGDTEIADATAQMESTDEVVAEQVVDAE